VPPSGRDHGHPRSAQRGDAFRMMKHTLATDDQKNLGKRIAPPLHEESFLVVTLDQTQSVLFENHINRGTVEHGRHGLILKPACPIRQSIFTRPANCIPNGNRAVFSPMKAESNIAAQGEFVLKDLIIARSAIQTSAIRIQF
jgi:hypothetical protein